MKRNFGIVVVLAVLAAVMLTGCANYGTAPGGGPKDETPPALVQSLPKQGATGITTPAKIKLNFSEYVVLQNTDKIVVSPPLDKVSFSAYLKQVTISVDEDSLPANTTYSINFKDAIGDLHEANPVQDFTYVFSTGPTIDSAQLSGTVIDACTLEPVREASVLFFAQKPQDYPPAGQPDYVATTAANGAFRVGYMREGCYWVFAVKEGFRDYKIDPTEEKLAYSDFCWEASVQGHTVPDTAAATTSDTAAAAGSTDSTAAALPDSTAAGSTDPTAAGSPANTAISDHILYLYQDYEDQKFLKEAKFPARGEIQLSWYYLPDSLDFEILENANTDAAPRDTLREAAARPVMCRVDNPAALQSTLYFDDYNKTDILLVTHAGPYTDTTELALPTAARRKSDTAAFKVSLQSTTIAHTDSLVLTFNLPVKQINWDDAVLTEIITDEDGHKVERALARSNKVERTSVRSSAAEGGARPPAEGGAHPPAEGAHPHPLTTKKNLIQDWQPGADYRLFLPSSCFTDFLGRSLDTTVLQFSVIPLETYGEMAVNLQGLTPGIRYILQLTDPTRKTVFSQQALTQDGLYVFPHVKPGGVTFVLFEDPNGNGLWDRGHYPAARQSERRWHYAKTMQAEADWRIEETWSF